MSMKHIWQLNISPLNVYFTIWPVWEQESILSRTICEDTIPDYLKFIKGVVLRGSPTYHFSSHAAAGEYLESHPQESSQEVHGALRRNLRRQRQLQEILRTIWKKNSNWVLSQAKADFFRHNFHDQSERMSRSTSWEHQSRKTDWKLFFRRVREEEVKYILCKEEW